MQFEVGQKYLTRGGWEAVIIWVYKDKEIQVVNNVIDKNGVSTEMSFMLNEQGKVNNCSDDDYDLVTKISEAP
jgi:hypothetical protein